MAQVSYSELRNKLASYMDEVCDSHAPLLVTRQNARSVVIMAEEDYDGLMRSPFPLPQNRHSMVRHG
jgi:antitoxin YefM